jgi:hypothetical protein
MRRSRFSCPIDVESWLVASVDASVGDVKIIFEMET